MMKIITKILFSLLLSIVINNAAISQWLISDSHAWIQMDQDDTHTINGTTFKCWGNNTQYVYINIDGASSPHTIAKYNIRKYNSETLLVAIEESSVDWGYISFGSRNNGYVSFNETTIICNPGDRIQFDATSNAVLTATSPDIYQNATVRNWCDYNGVVIGSGGHSATYFFDIPNDYVGSQYFYMGVHLSPGNTKFVQYLRIISSEPTEEISTPNTPTGPSSVKVGQSLSFSTGGSSSNLGHSVEYQFDWGDGTQSSWGSSTQSHSFSSSGTKYVKAHARCQTHTSIVSSWSSTKSVSISYCTLTINVSPSGTGSVSKNPNKTNYDYNETVQLTANADSGYQFDHWGGDLSGDTSPKNLTMNSNKSVTAYFTQIPETVSTPNTPTGPSTGKVGQSLSFSTGGSSSNLGHSVEYQFDWGDGNQSAWGSATQSHSYGAAGTKYVKAHARCQSHTSVVSGWSNTKSISISYCTLTINESPSGTGSVNKNPDKTNYNYNEIVQLTANANSGYKFDHWGGDLSGSTNPNNLTMNSNKNVTAYFTEIPETVSTPSTPTGPSSGKVAQSLSFSTGGSSSNLGHSVQYQFDWGDGSQSSWGSSSQSHSYSSTGTKYVKARACCQSHTSVVSSWSSTKSVLISYCTLTISISPTGKGSVSKNPNKTNYNYNETVQLTANANSGYEFDHWSGDLSGSTNPNNLTMNSNKNVTAYFTQIPETVSTPNTPTGPSSGKIAQSLSFSTGGSSSNLGHSVQYQFDWGDGSQSSWGSSSQSHSYSSTGTKYVKARARCQSHTSVVSSWSSTKSVSISYCTLTISISPTGKGSVSKNPNKTNYNYNETVQLNANANSGYQFDHWGGNLSGSTNPNNLTMNSNKNVTAYFIQITEIVSTPNTPSGPSSGKIAQGLSFSTGGSSSNLGHEVEYRFNWADGNYSSWGSSSRSHSYSSIGTFNVKAQARCKTHTSVTSSWSSSKSVTISYCQLSISVDPSGSGSVSKSPNKTNFSYNETVQLEANANSGYEFDHWEGNLSGNNNPATLTMNEDKNITAFFNQILETVSTPSILSAPSNGKVGQNLSFITGGAVSNLGHHIEYRFDWGDENISAWGDSSQNHTYINIGTYVVKSIARCQVDTNIVSIWSSENTIIITGHTLEVSISPTGSGSVLKSMDKAEYNHNEIVILTANPNNEYQFDRWGNDLTGRNNPDTLTIDSDKTIVAHFSTLPDTTPPFVSDFSPTKEDTNVSINANIVVHIKDDSSGVDSTSIVMQVNLKQVHPKISGNQNDVVLIYDPAVDFEYDKRITVILDAKDNAGNEMPTEYYSFYTEQEPQNPMYISMDVQEHGLGEEFVVDIKMRDVKHLFGVSLIFNYPEQYLEYKSSVQGDFLGSNVIFYYRKIAEGKFSISVTKMENNSGANGNGVVALIKMIEKPGVLTGTNISLSLADVSAIDTSGNSLALTAKDTSYIAPPPPSSVTLNNHSSVKEYTLYPNYPNPFNPTTTISYALPKASNVQLQIFDINGRLVKTLLDGYKSAGIHQIEWGSRDDLGNRVTSGIYICRMTIGKIVLHQKLILAK